MFTRIVQKKFENLRFNFEINYLILTITKANFTIYILCELRIENHVINLK